MDTQNIHLIQSNEQTNLYEGVIPDEGLVRRILPAKNRTPTQEEFEQGVPSGLPFAELIGEASKDLPQNLETALHNAGIWTVDDLRTKGKQAVGAFQAAYGLELSRLIQIAEAYKPVIVKAPKAKKEINHE
jgi:hypothetical protein